MYTVPPDDGTFIPTHDNAPSNADLDTFWEFDVITEDTQLLYDDVHNKVLHVYELNNGALGVWQWGALEVHEKKYECPDPNCDYDHSEEAEFVLLAWQQWASEAFASLRPIEGMAEPFDSPYDAMRAGWFAFYTFVHEHNDWYVALRNFRDI